MVLQRDISDPRIEGLVSVLDVDVSPDMRNATVRVSVLPAEKAKTTLKGLEAAKVHIQHETRKRVALRIVPHLEFRLDESLKKQATVLDAIAKAMESTPPAPPESSPPEDTTGSDIDDLETADDGNETKDQPNH